MSSNPLWMVSLTNLADGAWHDRLVTGLLSLTISPFWESTKNMAKSQWVRKFRFSGLNTWRYDFVWSFGPWYSSTFKVCSLTMAYPNRIKVNKIGFSQIQLAGFTRPLVSCKVVRLQLREHVARCTLIHLLQKQWKCPTNHQISWNYAPRRSVFWDVLSDQTSNLSGDAENVEKNGKIPSSSQASWLAPGARLGTVRRGGSIPDLICGSIWASRGTGISTCWKFTWKPVKICQNPPIWSAIDRT